jgi:hypothetical protein
MFEPRRMSVINPLPFCANVDLPTMKYDRFANGRSSPD